MEKRKLTPEHKKAMLGDLMQRYPRGNNGKLRHYHYRTTTKPNDWGESSRLDDPALNPDHPKLPQQEEDTFLGWKLSDIWLIDPSEWALRPILSHHFPDLSGRQVTMRSRRLERRLSRVIHEIKRNGRPGMYQVGESYGNDYQTYIYATSNGEAEQLASMFLQPAAKGKYLSTRFQDFAVPEDISSWHALGKEKVAGTIRDLEERISKMKETIAAINTFQHSAEMVSSSISAMAAEKSLKGMEE